MRRSEQREHIFKLLFMTQFNSENEMSDQVSMYFDTLGELEEKDQEAIQNKYQHILEHLDEIDQILNDYSRGWKTTRMSRVDLTALRLAVYEMKFDEDVPVERGVEIVGSPGHGEGMLPGRAGNSGQKQEDQGQKGPCHIVSSKMFRRRGIFPPSSGTFPTPPGNGATPAVHRKNGHEGKMHQKHGGAAPQAAPFLR